MLDNSCLRLTRMIESYEDLSGGSRDRSGNKPTLGVHVIEGSFDPVDSAAESLSFLFLTKPLT